MRVSESAGGGYTRARAALAWVGWLLAALGVLPSLSQAQTSLSDRSVRYTVPETGYVALERGPVRAVVVDNRAVDVAQLPRHRAGYSGVASLTHERQGENLFVPEYAGLNFEHIHDGTAQPRDVLYEPRRAAMELRAVDANTAELYQQPTPHWGLESCQRVHLLEDGTIELTIECIPRKAAYRHGYLGLFWASYIHKPQSRDIHFLGHPENGAGNDKPRWIRATTPKHGVDAAHIAASDTRDFTHDENFPLTLMFNRSAWRFAEPWYFGVSGEMAFAQLFRPGDRVRFAQSPSGGGDGNPAWDFQFFISKPQVGQLYRFVMRAAYVPGRSPDEVRRQIEPHLNALGEAERPGAR